MPQWVPWTLVVGRCLVSFPTPVLGGCQHHSPSEIGLVFQLAWELGDALIRDSASSRAEQCPLAPRGPADQCRDEILEPGPGDAMMRCIDLGIGVPPRIVHDLVKRPAAPDHYGVSCHPAPLPHRPRHGPDSAGLPCAKCQILWQLTLC
jgi:hypothetical protein